MPINGYTVGRDVVVSIMTSTGPLRIRQITGFKSKPDMTDQKIKRLDGVTDHLRFPDGWTGSFEVERQDATVDNYFAQLEANYYAGQNEQACEINETIENPDGSVSQFKYTGVLLKLDDAGDKKGNASVKQMISFLATRRLKVV